MSNPTAQQLKLDAAVQNLIAVIEEVIPSTTAHFAVEATRQALAQLGPRALFVTTEDVNAANKNAEIMGRITSSRSSTYTEERISYDAEGNRVVEVLAEGSWVQPVGF